MEYELSIDPQKVCRICLLETDQLQNIYTNLIVDGYIISIPEMTKYCIDIEVESNEKLPDKICDICKLKIMKFYAFKRKSIRTNKALLLTTTLSINKNNVSQVEPSDQSSPTNCKNDLNIPQSNNIDNDISCSNEQNNKSNNYNVNDNNQNFKENLTELSKVPPVQLMNLEYDKHTIHDNELTVLTKSINNYDCNIISDDSSENLRCETEKSSELIVENDHNDDIDEHVDIVADDDDNYNMKNENIINIKNISAALNFVDDNAIDEHEYDIELDQVNTNDEYNDDDDNGDVEKIVQHENFCSKCSILFLSEDSFNEHIQTHSNNNKTNEDLEKIIEIPIRISDTSDSDDYNNNNNNDDDDDNDKEPINKICPECNKKFTKKSQYDHHLQMHKSTKLIADTFDYFPCHNCHILYINEQQLFEHIRVQHSFKDNGATFVDNVMCTDYQFLDDKTNSHENVNYNCGICKSKYFSIKELKQHIITHSDNFICPYEDCGCQYKILSRLSNHIMEKHVYEHGQIHRCRYCDVDVFKSYDELQNHLKNNCLERKYKCTHCDKKFFSKKARSHHLRSADRKKFICQFCSKSFTQQGELTIHNRTHTGERPFICTICGKAYKTSSMRTAHMDAHIQGKTFECSVCDKKLQTRTSYRNHMKRHTEDKKHNCEECGKKFFTKYHLKLHASKIHDRD